MEPGEGSVKELDGLIRGRQILAMEANVPKSLFGYLLAAGVASIVAWKQWSSLLMYWAPIVTVVCLARSAVALKLTHLKAPSAEVSLAHFLCVATALVAISMAVAPVWIILHSDAYTGAVMMALLLSTLWGGAFVQAPLLQAAVSFTCATLPVWLVCLLLSTETVNETQAVMAGINVVCVGVALDNVRRYASDFATAVVHQHILQRRGDQVRKQADLIALLLKEHEDQSSDWLWQCDASARLVMPGQRFIEAFAGSGQSLEGQRLNSILLAPEVAGNTEAIARLEEHLASHRAFREIVVPGMLGESQRWWSISGRPVLNKEGHLLGFRGMMGDITVAREAQAHIDFLANHDGLTGLANRSHFNSRVQADLKLRGRRTVGVISIDLDGFKPINDRYGHSTGDEVLIAVSRILREVTSARGVAARLGADEFAIVTTGLDVPGLQSLCRRLVEALGHTLSIGPHEIAIGASIGVAVAPADGEGAEELIKNADAALYRAKRSGRGQYRFFEAEMDRQIQLRTFLQQELREAIGSGQLVLHYQPYVDAVSGRVTGCEALLRWFHPSRGLVSPAEFIPVAEESGLITEIGKEVIVQACEAARQWPEHIRVSVNVSPRQFKDSTLPRHIENVLLHTKLSPQRLEVEVTEAVLIDDAAAAMEILRRIRAIGIKLALDDFGTGYSSLSYLRDFPFDKVKIDRSFVRDIEERHDSQVIVQGIRSIALGLGMTVTAEGVETVGQATRLRTAGCNELQGFLFSKAQPAAEIPALLLQHHEIPRVAGYDDSRQSVARHDARAVTSATLD